MESMIRLLNAGFIGGVSQPGAIVVSTLFAALVTPHDGIKLSSIVCGPFRHVASPLDFRRFRGEADVN